MRQTMNTFLDPVHPRSETKCRSAFLSWFWWVAAFAVLVLMIVPALRETFADDAVDLTLDAPAAPDSEKPEVLTPGVRRVLILCGHPGDDEHRTRFAETVAKLHQGFTERLAVDSENVILLFNDGELPAVEGAEPRVDGPCNKEEIIKAAERLKASLKPADALWVVAMGHGYFDGRRSQFNLPGPDVDQHEFGKIFDGVACRELVFWITIPAAGFYVKPLSADGRIVVTATEADRETNETEFPHNLAAVLSEPPDKVAFDVDGDGKPTLLDLYVHVVRRTLQNYADENALPTEHALLDDNGDGRGTEVQLNYLPESLGGRLKDPVDESPEDGDERDEPVVAETSSDQTTSDKDAEPKPAPAESSTPPGESNATSPNTRKQTLDGARAAALVLAVKLDEAPKVEPRSPAADANEAEDGAK